MTQDPVQNAADVVAGDVRRMAERATDELDRLSGSQLLFTGGGGFLGYLFLNLLASIGDGDGRAPVGITVYENFSRGPKPWLDQLARRKNVTVVEHDITQPLRADMPQVDYIVHAASIASPIYYRLHPIETIDANVNGLRSFLDYGRARGDAGRPIKGLLFFSTSEIYGDPPPDQIPTAETFRGFVSCTGPRACYDESKRLGETLCVNFAQQYGVPVAMARPFNNYGPGLGINDRRILPDLARNILSNEDVVLLSDGRATRTFCYVADAVVGYTKILVKGKPGEPYNIGTESPEVTMRELAERVVAIGRELFGYRGAIVLQTSDDPAYLTDNPNRRCPDLSKARRDLEYVPEVGLDEGLRRSLIWYRENQS